VGRSAVSGTKDTTSRKNRTNEQMTRRFKSCKKVHERIWGEFSTGTKSKGTGHKKVTVTRSEKPKSLHVCRRRESKTTVFI
jgi:hypothetical protein